MNAILSDIQSIKRNITITNVLFIIVALLFVTCALQAFQNLLSDEATKLEGGLSDVSLERPESATTSFLDDGITLIPPQEKLAVEEIEPNTATEDLVEIQKEIEMLRDNIRMLTKNIEFAENEISVYEQKIEQKEREMQDSKNVAGYYAKVYYQTQRDAGTRFGFLRASSFPDFIYRYNTLSLVMGKIDRIIKKNLYDEEELDRNRSQLQLSTEMYRSLLADAEARYATLKDKQVEEMDFQATNRLDLDEEYLQVISSVGRYISNKSYNYTSRQSGRFMILPVEGEVTSPYGRRTHPIYGDSRHHAGVDIGVDYGTPIHAAADGIVIMAGWYGGYGKVVMIQHGNDIVSLYGHNDKVLVNDGDVVRQGQPIALAGSTGNSTGPHCHFEIRKGGEDIDPYTYVMKRR